MNGKGKIRHPQNSATMAFAMVIGVMLAMMGQATGQVPDTSTALRPEMDSCMADGALMQISPFAGASVRGNPGNLREKTMGTIPGIQSCGTLIDQAGIWFYFKGIGKRVRVSTCDEGAPNGFSRTQVETKLSIFSGDCDSLTCVGGGTSVDFDCPFRQAGDEWSTIGRAHEFDTVKNVRYSVLVQGPPGDAFLSVREVGIPRNDVCNQAIGPIPRDRTRIEGKLTDARRGSVPLCAGQLNRFPSVWYQIFGTGSDVTVGVCAAGNVDGFEITVYNAPNCNDLNCIPVTKAMVAADDVSSGECTYGLSGGGAAKFPMSTVTFATNDLDRYYVLVSSAKITSAQGDPTTFFRLYVDDGKDGNAGSGGAGSIEFRSSGTDDGSSTDGTDGSDDGSGSHLGPVTIVGASTILIMAASAVMLSDFMKQ